MKVSVILFLFLNIVVSISIWAGNPPVSLDSSIQSDSEISHPELSIQQSSILEVGDALTNTIVPERPVVRLIHYFFKSQSVVQESFSGLSAICQRIEQNFKKTAFTLDTNLPAFLIVFPHHYFT
jgi:hypothetical protein